MSDLGYFKNSKLIINKSEQKNGPHLNIMINIPISNSMLKEIKRKIRNICTIIPKPIKEEVDETSFVNKSNIDGDIKDRGTSFVDNLSTNNVIDSKHLATYSTTFSPLDILDPSSYIKPKIPKDLENNIDPIKIIKDINITGEILLSDGDTLNEESNIVQLKEPLAKANIKKHIPVKYSRINKLIKNDKVPNLKKSFLEKDILGNLNTDIEVVDTNNRNTRNTCSQKMVYSYPVTDVLAANSTTSSLNFKQENVKSAKYNNSEHSINENEVIGNIEHTFVKSKSIQSATIRDQKGQSEKLSDAKDSLKLKKETDSLYISTDVVLGHESLSDVSKMKNTEKMLVNSQQSSNFLNRNVISVSLSNSTLNRVDEDDIQKINYSSCSKHKRSDNQSFEVNKDQNPESKQKKVKFDKIPGEKQTKSKILCIKKVQKISANVKCDIPREVISKYNLSPTEMSKHIGNGNSGGIVLTVDTGDKTKEKFERNYNTKTLIEPSDVQSLNNSNIGEKMKAESIEPIKYSLNHGMKRSLLNDINDNYHTTKKGKFQQLCSQASKRNKRLQFRESTDCFELRNNNGKTMSNNPEKNTVKVNTLKQYFTAINMSIEERQDKENNQRNFDTLKEDSVNTINDIPNVTGTEKLFILKDYVNHAKTDADNLASREISKGNIQEKSNSSNSRFFAKTNGVNSNNVRENGTKPKNKTESSEDEENFTDIMNYIKDYVNNEKNFKLNKTRSKTYKLLVKNKFVDFETSDNYSSDSSVGEYTTHLRRKYRDDNARKNMLMNEKQQFSKLSGNKKENCSFEDFSQSENKNVQNRRKNGTNQIELLKEKPDSSFKNLNDIDDQRDKISDKFLHLSSEKGVARNNTNKSSFWETGTDKFTKKKSNMHTKLKDKNGHTDTNQRDQIKIVASSKPIQLSTPQNTVGNVQLPVQLFSETKILNCDSNKYFNKKVNKIVNKKLRNQTENIIEGSNLNCVKFCNDNKIKISQKDKNKKIADFCQSVSKNDIFENSSSKRIKHTNIETNRFTNRNNNCSLKKVIHKNANDINQHELCTRNSSESETSNSLKPIQFGNSENNLIVGVLPHLFSKNKTLLADSILTTEVNMNGNTRNKQHNREQAASNSVEQLKWLERKQLENSKYTTNENDNSSPSSAKVNGKETQKEEQRLILSFCDRILAQRYDNKSKSKNSEIVLIDSDDSSAGYGISEFETEKDTDSEECKTKILEIISYADDELLNIVEENEQLRDLRINISWDVPISHTIETRVSSCPTKAQQQLFKDLNIQIKYGPFTKFEDDTIKENFKHFCMEHGLHYDPVPFLNFRYGKITILKRKERIKFGRYLGRGLENRKLFCIYNRFKVLYSSFTKGRFTPEEDAVILKYMKLISDNTKQFSSLSKILHRPRPSIEKRYRLLQRGSQILKVKDYPIFVNRLMEVTNCDRLECLRDRYITDVEWKKVSKKLNVCKNHLKICWKLSLYTKIFHNGPIKVDSIMRRLLARLDATEEDDYRKLNWTKLAEPFKPVTRAFLYRIFKRVQKNKVPLYLHTNLRKCVIYLRKLYEENEVVMPNISNIVLEL